MAKTGLLTNLSRKQFLIVSAKGDSLLKSNVKHLQKSFWRKVEAFLLFKLTRDKFHPHYAWDLVQIMDILMVFEISHHLTTPWIKVLRIFTKISSIRKDWIVKSLLQKVEFISFQWLGMHRRRKFWVRFFKVCKYLW